MASSITVNELVQALEAAVKKSPAADGAMTVNEMRVRFGWGEGKVRNALFAIKAEGRLEVVKSMRENLAGEMMRTIAYRILPKKKGK